MEPLRKLLNHRFQALPFHISLHLHLEEQLNLMACLNLSALEASI